MSASRNNIIKGALEVAPHRQNGSAVNNKVSIAPQTAEQVDEIIQLDNDGTALDAICARRVGRFGGDSGVAGATPVTIFQLPADPTAASSCSFVVHAHLYNVGVGRAGSFFCVAGAQHPGGAGDWTINGTFSGTVPGSLISTDTGAETGDDHWGALTVTPGGAIQIVGANDYNTTGCYGTYSIEVLFSKPPLV